jgi:NDP-sugar pyrophosphorylase family protein
MIDRAVILAAGRGTRLGDLTETTPKPLLDVGGKPIIQRILEGLAAAEIYEVAVITGYRADHLEDAVWGMAGLSIEFIRQSEPRGTGAALLLAQEFTQGQRFFFGWADILVEPGNYRAVLESSDWADVVLAVNYLDDPSAGAAVSVDDEFRVERIVEKPPPGTAESHWNNAGFGVMGPVIWDHLDRVEPSPRGEIELTDALTAAIDDGAKVVAVPVQGPWFDIGTVEALEAAREHYG